MITTYIVEGGLGKCIAFSALIPKLVQKNNAKIRIYTPYPEVFIENPNVEWVLDQNTINIDHEYIQESDDIVYVEPYKSDFVKGKKHLIQSYADLLGVTWDSDEHPKLYTDYVANELKTTFKKGKVKKDYIIVQFSGGQSSVDWENNSYYKSGDEGRNYNSFFAQRLINLIHEKYPNLSILNYSLPNEPHYENTIKFAMKNSHWHEALKKATGFISIDSSLQHMAASTGTKGIVLWGSTRWTQFGYKRNCNLNYYMQNDWDESLFDAMNPLNILVTPEIILSKFDIFLKTV